MIADPHQTQEQFNQEVADIEWMDQLDAETPVGSIPLSPLGHRAPAAPSPAAAAAGAYDARLIREARELADLRTFGEKVDWLTANGHPQADGYEDSTVHAIIAGNMQYVLSRLATGYERELSTAAAIRRERDELSRRLEAKRELPEVRARNA